MGDLLNAGRARVGGCSRLRDRGGASPLIRYHISVTWIKGLACDASVAALPPGLEVEGGRGVERDPLVADVLAKAGGSELAAGAALLAVGEHEARGLAAALQRRRA